LATTIETMSACFLASAIFLVSASALNVTNVGIPITAVSIPIFNVTNFPSAIATPGQPAALALWPAAGCLKTVAIRAFPSWEGQCLELDEITGPTGATNETCRQQCFLNKDCSTWQFSEEGKCFSGTGTNCQGRNGETPLNVTGAERFQRGDVTILKNMNNTWVYGLRHVGVFTSGTSAANAGRCRDYCYSNLGCQYWQFGSDGCWAEDRGKGYLAQFPLTLTTVIGDTEGAISSEVVGNTNPARTMVAAEYIQHVCPPQPTLAPVIEVQNDTNTALWVGLAVAGLLLASLLAFFFCCKTKEKRSRAVKKTRGAKVAPKAEVPLVEAESLMPLMMPAPAMQYAPQMQFPSYQPQQQFQTYMR